MRPLPVSALVVLALLSGALATAARAQHEERDFSTVRFRPAVGPGNYLALEGAEIAAHGARSYALFFDYAADTLVVDHPCRALSKATLCDAGRTVFLEQAGLAHALFGLGLHGHTQLSLDLPLGFSDARPEPLAYVEGALYREVRPRDGFVLGDVRLASKTRVYGGPRDALRVAVGALVTLPTGMLTSRGDCREADTCSFLGERGVQAGAQAIVEYTPHGALRLAGNIGVLYRPARELLGTEVGSELTFGTAAAYRIVPRLFAKAEIAGALELAGADDLPLEARGGLSYGRDLVVTLGGGAGILGKVGSPTYRVLAGLQWTPTRRDPDGDGLFDAMDRCPHVAEDRDGFEDGDGCPDLDNDRDHLVDTLDECRDAPEDHDGFRDEDGCPDPDNDQDGVLDGYDTCEGEQEDHDGDRDDDGCPDHDIDRDGVPDASDRCPDQAEDTDGLGDEDGCPELDHDGDTLPDTEDACPDVAAPPARVRAKDGCPP